MHETVQPGPRRRETSSSELDQTQRSAHSLCCVMLPSHAVLPAHTCAVLCCSSVAALVLCCLPMLRQAVEKYTRAAESLKLDSTTEAQAVVKACYLNSAACLLKLERWDEAEDACDQVLEGESSNLKALFRRGQAFTGQGMKTEAIADLKAAMAVSAAEDPQIAAALLKAEALEEQPKQKEDRGFWEKRSIGELRKELTRRGVDCSQCTEKAELVDLVCSGERKKKKKKQPVVPSPAAQPQMNVSAEQMEQVQQQMKQNPAMMKEAAERMASMSDEEIARMGAMTGQKFDPAMAKTAASMMKNMSPEQMAQQMEMARQMQANQGGEGGLSAAADSLKGMSEEQLSGLNSTMAANGQPGITPEMASMAGDMMKNMSADDMKSMMEMSQNMQKGGQPSMADAAKMTEMMSKNPEMLKNITQSMQSMDPEQLQKMGISPDQAAKLGDTVQNMDPATLESMMKWGGRAAKVASPFVSGYQKVRSLDRQTMIHVLILVLAGLFIGHFTNSF
eukprot:TRINITY_DN6526_c0_g1_i5.p1 TRINITY_DN6526_c0_g1~~TRINITY_DN6526_c0_g1_i5.p1  ORF type:complete len:506 (+),score=200.24 TRINITY_DN6526_c0_g1_i5:359-1876(+)